MTAFIRSGNGCYDFANRMDPMARCIDKIWQIRIPGELTNPLMLGLARMSKPPDV